MSPKSHSQNIAVIILCILAFFLFAATQSAHARPAPQEPDVAPTVTVDTQGTPALLQTPISDEMDDAQGSGARALLMTAILLMCGMVAMLVGGIGIAMIMVRLRNRIRRE